MRELDKTTVKKNTCSSFTTCPHPFFTARYLEKEHVSGGVAVNFKGGCCGGFCPAVARFIQIPNAETPNNTGGHRVRTHASYKHITQTNHRFTLVFFLPWHRWPMVDHVQKEISKPIIFSIDLEQIRCTSANLFPLRRSYETNISKKGICWKAWFQGYWYCF